MGNRNPGWQTALMMRVSLAVSALPGWYLATRLDAPGSTSPPSSQLQLRR